MRRHLHPGTSWRRAVILIVVLTLLALFAIVGLTALLYAQNSARSSVNFAKGWQATFQGSTSSPDGGGGFGVGGGGPGTTGGTYVPPNIPPGELFSWGMGQYLYDTEDSNSGARSGLRGHSVSRTKWGYTDSGLNIQPFNGMGRVHFPSIGGVDDYNLINYSFFPGQPLRDPERLGTRADPTQARGQFVGGANPPVTYPNLDNLALAASRADGTNLMPSFHRPWLFGSLRDQSNPNWTNLEGRFMTLRPRPADNLGFPYPSEDGGDVKNKVGYPGGNDSIWIDLGYPERRAADGRRFKPLFAFHVEDLDGKLNISTAGNLMGRDASKVETHASGQGWGKWEQSILKLFQQAGSPAPQEWLNLFVGNPNAPLISSRYGPNRVPVNGTPMLNKGKLPRFLAQGDQNASDDTNNLLPTGPIQFLPNSCFPVFPGGYENGSQNWEFNARHFDYFRPAGYSTATDDRLFPLSDMKKLLVNSYTGMDPMSASVVQLMPQTLGTDPAGLKRRSLITLLSMDTARLGMSPWLYEQGAQNATKYTWTNPELPPNSQAVPTSFTDAMGNNRLRRDVVDAVREAVNLDQHLRPYPHQDATAMLNYHDRFDNNAGILQMSVDAQTDRQNMAADIFLRLLIATGTPGPADASKPTPSELVPIRWMAQLAVNIVDYIDEDEINTPFNYYPTAFQYYVGRGPNAAEQTNLNGLVLSNTNAGGDRIPQFWVFGTELPAVVLNEVFTQYELPNVAGVVMDGKFDVKVWAELHNPFPGTVPGSVQQQDAKEVPLFIPQAGMGPGPYSPYKVVVANVGGPWKPTPENYNVNGVPDQVRITAPYDNTMVTSVAAAQAKMPPDVAMAVNPNQGGGFFLMGPKTKPTRNDPPGLPGPVPYFETDNMQYNVTYTAGNWADANGASLNGDKTNGVTVMLRRLANPHLPPQDDPNQGYYNPYITMDYIDNVRLSNATLPTDVATAQGKKQPYGSNAAQIVNQQYTPDPMGANQHSLGQANNDNGNATGNRNWLVHLDRQVISPFELLNVSGYRPHMLTQTFLAGGIGQRAPWLDEDLGAGFSHRLYRAFAFLTIPDRAAGVSPNGRVPGKININTIWDFETFAALCDRSVSNTFTDPEVLAAWTNLSNRRPLNGTDRPILDLGAAFLPANDPVAGANGRGLDDTFIKLFQTGNGHPYLKNELLTKIANSVTTRSNTFAVWLTTGFFEVLDSPTITDPVTGRPAAVLGAEIGRSDGQEIRYRFFSIVDRTQMVIAPRLTTAVTGAGINPSTNPQPVKVGALNGTITYSSGSAAAWSIAPGSVVVVDRGSTSEETVVVTAVDGANMTFSAVFRREHTGNNVSVTMHGNPGPKPGWDPYDPSEMLVVPYWELLN